jgi:hypothetical protein
MSAKKEKTSRSENSYFAALTLGTNDDSSWYVDSGATSHLISHLDWFKKEKMTGVEVSTAGTNKLECLGSGSVRVKFKYDALIQNNTWNLVELPEGKKPISCKCVYTVKNNTYHGGHMRPLSCAEPSTGIV